MLVKSKVKTYPNGEKETLVYKKPVYTGGQDNKKINPIYDIDKVYSDQQEKEHNDYMNLIKIKNTIKDYCLSNDFDMFWTLTFANERTEDDRAFIRLSNWLKYMKNKYGKFRYIFIPERHKDGCIHFHGVTGGFNGRVRDSEITHGGKSVYNCMDWQHGFSTITMIQDRRKIALYITKYITKNLNSDIVGKGKKKYWSSRGLRRPEVETLSYNPKDSTDPDPVFENDTVVIFND